MAMRSTLSWMRCDMQLTVKDLKYYLEKLDNDAVIWMELPRTIAKPEVIITVDKGGPDETKFVECMSIGIANDGSALYIYHHY